jgi:hypothetical protein
LIALEHIKEARFPLAPVIFEVASGNNAESNPGIPEAILSMME